MATTADTSQVSTEEVVCDKLTLGGVSTEKILQESDYADQEYTVTDLVSAGYLDQALVAINNMLDLVDPDGTLLDDLNLISLSLVNSLFEVQDEWGLLNWAITDNKAVFNGGEIENSLTINKDLDFSGAYLLCVNVGSLPSGKLDIYLNDTWQSSILNTGTYYTSVTVSDPANDQIKVVANGATEGDEIEIYTFSLHFVAERLNEYIVYRVNSLSEVNTEDFVAKDVYLKDMEELSSEIGTQFTTRDTNLEEHTSNTENPHKVTPEQIGAAPTTHTHGYTSTSDVASIVTKALTGYSPTDHTHSQYLNKDDADVFLAGAITDFLGQFISVAPMVVTQAPTGVLPSRFMPTNLSIPLQIILPSTIAHNTETSYDATYGIVSTNLEELITECPKVFSIDTEEYATIPLSIYEEFTAINFRICFHHQRKISGYRIHTINHTPQDWGVYSSNTDFIHRISSPTYEELGDGKYATTHLFVDTEYVDSLSFIFRYNESYDYPETEWNIRIELLYEDFTNTQFGITDEKVQFCVPTNGVNRIISLDNDSRITVEPEIISEDIPLYVYGGSELADSSPTFYMSYYPPEYSNERRGMNVFIDKFRTEMKDETSLFETYKHPAFGTFTLAEGSSAEGYDITTAYSSSEDSWMSDGADDKVVFEQTIDSDKVMLRGFMLNWREQDVNNIPTTFTLTVEGYDADGNYHTRVFDSVDTFYPAYSVEDDDIVYHKVFDVDMYVKKIQLSLVAETSGQQIAINKIYWYLSERFYSIPQNTMYLGMETVSQMCLGSVIYQGSDIGWVPSNVSLGRSCVVPVNNLQMTEMFTEYKVPNPFFTTDVTATIQNYVLQSDDSSVPSAYITNIESETITVMSERPFRYAVAVARTW